MKHFLTMSDNMMSRRTVVSAIGSIVLAGVTLAACDTTSGTSTGNMPGTPASNTRTPAFVGKLEQYLQHMAEQNLFSGTILLAQGAQPVLMKAYGQANKAQHLPNRLETIYALGSVTKSFTAVAILQLVEQGKLALHDPLGRYLSGFPSSIANQVTIDQLLTHTSGMGDLLRTPQFQSESASWVSGEQTMQGLLSIIRRQPLLFVPGSKWLYSNSGYVTLGEIVQQISGQSYYDYVRQHIFQVAGMSQSNFYSRPQRQISLFAHPYSKVGGQFIRPGLGPGEPVNGSLVDVSDLVEYIGYPSGSAYSNVGNMLRYSQALQSYHLLNEASTKLLMAGKVKTPPILGHQRDTYAYGLSDSIVNGQRVVWHNGGSGGIAAQFELYPASGWTVAILSNYDPDTSFQALVKEEEALVSRAS